LIFLLTLQTLQDLLTWVKRKGLATSADPAVKTSRDSQDQSMIRDVMGDHRTSGYECIFSNGDSTDDRHIGSNGSASFEKCRQKPF
jgi:hypothetical protein